MYERMCVASESKSPVAKAVATKGKPNPYSDHQWITAGLLLLGVSALGAVAIYFDDSWHSLFVLLTCHFMLSVALIPHLPGARLNTTLYLDSDIITGTVIDYDYVQFSFLLGGRNRRLFLVEYEAKIDNWRPIRIQKSIQGSVYGGDLSDDDMGGTNSEETIVELLTIHGEPFSAFPRNVIIRMRKNFMSWKLYGFPIFILTTLMIILWFCKHVLAHQVTKDEDVVRKVLVAFAVLYFTVLTFLYYFQRKWKLATSHSGSEMAGVRLFSS
jgi:hypothetical protein